MLDYILDLVARLGHWSYVVIFLLAALECAAFIGLLIPGESLMLATGFFAQHFSVGCYCADESRCHRSLLRKLLVEAGATVL